MKKRKILILLMMAFMLLVTPLSACGDGDDTSGLELQGFSNYLSVKEKVYHTSASQLEGQMVAFNSERNIVVLKTSETSVGGEITDTFKVYDLETLEVVHKSTANYSYGVENPYKIESVSVDNYPIIEMTRVEYVESWNSETQKTTYEPYFVYEYFLPGVQESFVCNREGTIRVNKKQNLYECILGDFVYWISADYEVLRTYPTFVTSGYASPKFDAEYNGYLYDYKFDVTARKIQVFNKEGVCQVEYDYPQNVCLEPTPYVLNNGNIFVQEYVRAEVGEDYDVEEMVYNEETDSVETVKCKIVSKIINYQTGEAETIKFDYIVTGFDSYYSQEQVGTDFPFELVKGKHNQAFLTKIVNNAPSNTIRYAVLDNSMKIVFAVENDTLNSSPVGYVEVFGMKDGYIAAAPCGDGAVAYYFDYEGNIKCTIPENVIEITDKYIVTSTAILDYSLNVVLDFETCDIIKRAGLSYLINVYGNQICAKVYNPYTAAMETYKFDGAKFVLVADGIKTNVAFLNKSYVVTDLENDTIYTYAYTGELLLIYQHSTDTTKNLSTYTFNGINFITAEIGGNNICYVVR